MVVLLLGWLVIWLFGGLVIILFQRFSKLWINWFLTFIWIIWLLRRQLKEIFWSQGEPLEVKNWSRRRQRTPLGLRLEYCCYTQLLNNIWKKRVDLGGTLRRFRGIQGSHEVSDGPIGCQWTHLAQRYKLPCSRGFQICVTHDASLTATQDRDDPGEKWGRQNLYGL